MNPFDFEQLRPGKADCPSDMSLWRLNAGELQGNTARELQQHVESCPDCSTRMAERRAGFDTFPEVDPQRMLAAIRRQGEAKATSSWMSRLRLLLAPLAVVAAASVFLIARPHHSGEAITDAPDEGRLKGGGVLHVFREVNGLGQEVVNGEHFKPGDRLRFTVDLPAESRVQIIGVEASGHLYQALPQGAETVTLPAGKAQPLAGAVELDESVGPETLYLVSCTTEGAAPACASTGASTPPTCRQGCETKPFVLTKGR